MGGPEAGNVRVVPDDDLGKIIQGDNGYLYQLHPLRMKGASNTMWFAYAANQHPMQMFLDMWREYSPTAQIKRSHDTLTYNKLRKPSE